MNRSAVADSIPQETKDRVFAAAHKYHYRPNFVARSLRTQRSFIIGVIVPEVSEGYAAMVMSGIEDHLLREGLLLFCGQPTGTGKISLMNILNCSSLDRLTGSLRWIHPGPRRFADSPS